MALHLEKDSFLQMIRQSLSKDEYKEKLTSLILSALFENEGVSAAINCQKREPYTKEESTQTELTNEESSLNAENCTENVEPNNENIVVSRDYEKPNNLQQYSFDPYCSRLLAEDEELLWDQLRERSRSRSRSSSRSTTGTRSSSFGRRRASRSRSRTSSRSSRRRRRRASPSFRESRRITSARRMPVPYTRARPETKRGARDENY